jgi:chromosome partitioning protein
MIITVTGQKGGTKKTTTALNIGQMLKADTIIDLETNGSIGVINNLRKEHKLNVVKYEDRRELANFLANVKAGDTVIVDCGGFDSDLVNIAIKAADRVIIPITEGITDRNGLVNTHIKLTNLGIERMAVVFPNGEHHAKKHFHDLTAIVHELPTMIFKPELAIPSCSYVKEALSQGLSIAEKNKHCNAFRAYKKLCDELLPF